jgi:hypothetical protein
MQQSGMFDLGAVFGAEGPACEGAEASVCSCFNAFVLRIKKIEKKIIYTSSRLALT